MSTPKKPKPELVVSIAQLTHEQAKEKAYAVLEWLHNHPITEDFSPQERLHHIGRCNDIKSTLTTLLHNLNL